MFNELPIHAMFVHFPIALFIVAWGFEGLSLLVRRPQWHEMARSIFMLAVLGSAITVTTGFWEQWRLHLSHSVLTRHRSFGLMTLALGVITLFVAHKLEKTNSTQKQKIFFVLLSMIVFSVLTTSYFGGEMVYEYGVGVSQ